MLIVLAVLSPACGSDRDSVCAESSGARVCVVPTGGGSFRVEPEGLQPGSQFRVSETGPGSPIVDTIGANGRPRGSLGLLAGDGPYESRIEGTSRDGTPVAFVITCVPDGDDGCAARITTS